METIGLMREQPMCQNPLALQQLKRDVYKRQGQCSDSEQAIENMFEDRKTKISKSTFLQRIALEDQENLGFGCGIIRI